MAQTEPVVIQAESGTLGANIATGVDGAVTFVTTTVNRTTPPSAPTHRHVLGHVPRRRELGTVRALQRGSGRSANDDSWYFGNGFGEKVPETGAWSLQNEAGTGFTNPTATVLNGGAAGSNVFKWVKITGQPGTRRLGGA